MDNFIKELTRRRDFHQVEADRYNAEIKREQSNCKHDYPAEPDVVTHGQEVYYCKNCGKIETVRR